MNSGGFFLAMPHVHHVRVALGHVRGEAFNPRRLPDCRLRYPRTGELPGPRSYSALQPCVSGQRGAAHEARLRGLIARTIRLRALRSPWPEMCLGSGAQGLLKRSSASLKNLSVRSRCLRASSSDKM